MYVAFTSSQLCADCLPRVNDVVKAFVTLYSTPLGNSPWQDLAHLAASFGWTAYTNNTATEYLDGQGINPKFTREMVEAGTRVNYGQVEVSASSYLETL